MISSRSAEKTRTSWQTIGVLGGATAMITTFATATASVSIAPVLTLGAAAGLDLVFSRNSASRVGIDAEATTATALVDEPMRFRLAAQLPSGTTRLALRPLGSVQWDPLSVTLVDGNSEVVWVPDAIGLVTHLELQVETFHLGLAPQYRTAVTRLPKSVACIPSKSGREPLPPSSPSKSERLRLYLPGDRPNRIDWRATARTGQLHSRATALANEEITIVVDLGQDSLPAAARSACLQAAADFGRAALRAGQTLRLVDRELSTSAEALWPHGLETRVIDRLCTEAELLRRLARVTPGPPFPRPSDAEVFSPQITNETRSKP